MSGIRKIGLRRSIHAHALKALQGEPIMLYGDGSQTRSFCYLDDLITAIVAFMETDEKATGPINLGNPNEFTIRELVERVIRLTGSRSDLIREPLLQDDPKQRKPNISQAKQHLNWEPKIQLEEGLSSTIEYFRERI